MGGCCIPGIGCSSPENIEMDFPDGIFFRNFNIDSSSNYVHTGRTTISTSQGVDMGYLKPSVLAHVGKLECVWHKLSLLFKVINLGA